MQSIYFDDYELSSESAFNYVTHKMIEMVEQENKTVKDLSGYRWVIGDRVASSIFPERPTTIFDYDVVYENTVMFYHNGINFEPGVVNTKNCSNCRFGNDGICPKINVCVTSSLDQSPSHWMEMTAAQKIEKEMSNTKTDKKLVGDISSGYSYIDIDIAYKIEELNKKYLITNYDKMYVKKEDKNMLDLKIYMSGMFYGGVVTKPQDLIKNVIFSGHCTIVQWSDGDKTIVRCENEDFDKEKGLAMAIVKKFFGTNESKSNYNDIFKKWIPEEKKEETNDATLTATVEVDPNPVYLSVKEFAKKAGVSESTIRKQISKGKFLGAKKIDGKWMIPYGNKAKFVGDKED